MQTFKLKINYSITRKTRKECPLCILCPNQKARAALGYALMFEYEAPKKPNKHDNRPLPKGECRETQVTPVIVWSTLRAKTATRVRDSKSARTPIVDAAVNLSTLVFSDCTLYRTRFRLTNSTRRKLIQY